jgi:hypothetical protein
MVLSAVSGVSRYYHFSWDIPGMHLMWKKGTEATPASFGYAQALRWLRGSTIIGCNNTPTGLWSCELHSPSGHRGFLVWSVQGSGLAELPNDFLPIAYETLDGKFNAITSTGPITVGGSPVLFRAETPIW